MPNDWVNIPHRNGKIRENKKPSSHNTCTCGEYEAAATMGGYEQHDKGCNYLTLLNEFYRINGA